MVIKCQIAVSGEAHDATRPRGGVNDASLCSWPPATALRRRRRRPRDNSPPRECGSLAGGPWTGFRDHRVSMIGTAHLGPVLHVRTGLWPARGWGTWGAEDVWRGQRLLSTLAGAKKTPPPKKEPNPSACPSLREASMVTPQGYTEAVLAYAHCIRLRGVDISKAEGRFRRLVTNVGWVGVTQEIWAEMRPCSRPSWQQRVWQRLPQVSYLP
ncbi:hypothetical protein GQ53DRAFT_229096 [Thozetella sp. PMI_491]|nr:hypothetical protein GQ53DRAFT_229096 [Thozetella sp. PMI_491]